MRPPATWQEFRERHGMRACMLAPTKIIAGLGMSLGITVLQASGPSSEDQQAASLGGWDKCLDIAVLQASGACNWDASAQLQTCASACTLRAAPAPAIPRLARASGMSCSPGLSALLQVPGTTGDYRTLFHWCAALPARVAWFAMPGLHSRPPA